MSASMKAVVTTGHGGYEQLVYRDVAMPSPGPGEVLLQVLAAGINNTDINTRVGWYGTDATSGAKSGWNGATPFPLIQGADCCARVVQIGAQLQEPGGKAVGPTHRPLQIGQRVLVRSCMRTQGFASLQTRWLGTDFDGAFAQYVKVPASEAFVVHSDWDDAALATLPCAYGTAENMLLRAGVTDRDHLLVTGASGGVGSAVVQLALCRGARVTAITTADKLDAVRALGAQQVLRREDDLQQALGDDEITVVADNVAGEGLAQRLRLLARGGRYVSSGAIAGAQVTLDWRDVYLRDLRLIGCTAWDAPVFPNLIDYVERHAIRPLLAGSFALQDIAQAQQVFLQRRHLGNLVLVPAH